MIGPANRHLCDWVDGSVKPTIVGVYQRDYSLPPFVGLDIRYCLWDGRVWRIGYLTISAAAVSKSRSVRQSENKWRGLRYDPALSQVLAS